jgi:hypothetical protein
VGGRECSGSDLYPARHRSPARRRSTRLTTHSGWPKLTASCVPACRTRLAQNVRGPAFTARSGTPGLPLFRLTISEPEHSVWSNWGFQMSARLWAALFTMIAVAAVSALPRIDLPETAFDETDVPTIQAVVMTRAASSKCISSEAPSAPTPFARICNAQIRIISPAYTNQSSDSRQFRELLSTLRC